MTDDNRVVILGGHGKVALLATDKLKAAGYAVDSVIRNPDQRDDIGAVGGNPVVLDIETASVDELGAAFSGATAILFSAGAGGGNAERTRAVDYEAATRAMTAADATGVRRFVMVSFAGAGADAAVDRLDPEDSFYPYAKAKHDADAHLRESALDYTIVGPGRLTDEPATGKIKLIGGNGSREEDLPDDQRVTARENVAEVITYVIETNAVIRRTVNFYDGEIAIREALDQT